MGHSAGRHFLKLGAVALALTTISTAGLIVSADAAYAERGGKGNGGGNGRGNGGGNRDRGNDRSDRAERGNNGNGNGNGRGAIARELRGLNAAHANQRALENASPDSMPGKLYAYQTQQQSVSTAKDAELVASVTLERLIGLSEEEINEFYPDGGYEDAVAAASADYVRAQEETQAAETAAAGSLEALTGGRELSDAALAELNEMLGL